MPGYISLPFIFLLALLASAKVTLQSHSSRKFIRCRQDSVLFNIFLFSLMSLFLAVVFPIGAVNGEILTYAFFMALGSFLFQTFYAIALGSGPVSLTVLLSNFSILIVTVFSAVFFHEKFYISQLLGISLLIVSMIFSVQKCESEKKAGGRWLTAVILCILGNSFANCIQKVFSKTVATQFENADITFLVTVNALAALFALLCFLLRRLGKEKSKSSFGFSWRVLLHAAVISAILVVYQKLYFYALREIDGTLLFPTHAGLQVLFMTVVGVVFFKDILSRRQKWGVVLGIVSVILLNVKIGVGFSL